MDICGTQLIPPYSHLLSAGYVYGKTPFVKFGYNGDVDTGVAGKLNGVVVQKQKCKWCGVMK